MGDMNKPGEIVKASGIYKTSGGREATLSAGDRFPPAPAGGRWTAVHLTKTIKRQKKIRARRG